MDCNKTLINRKQIEVTLELIHSKVLQKIRFERQSNIPTDHIAEKESDLRRLKEDLDYLACLHLDYEHELYVRVCVTGHDCKNLTIAS